MIRIPVIPEIDFVAVYDARVPNQERFLLLVRERVNLAQFFVMTCWQHPDETVTPTNDFFWLGDRIVDPSTWIFIYTGRGTPQFGKRNDGEPYMSLHMGRSETLFNVPQLVPVLVRFDAMNIGRHFDTKTNSFITPVASIPQLPPG